jgi:hypothetical protein
MHLQNGHHIKVVCLLDPPASDASSFGNAAFKRAAEGGGWLTWVVVADNVSKVEACLGIEAVNSHRTKPDGYELSWKQIGVLESLEDKQLPLFIEWK